MLGKETLGMMIMPWAVFKFNQGMNLESNPNTRACWVRDWRIVNHWGSVNRQIENREAFKVNEKFIKHPHFKEETESTHHLLEF